MQLGREKENSQSKVSKIEIGPLKWTKNMSPFKIGSSTAKEKTNLLIPMSKFLFTKKPT